MLLHLFAWNHNKFGTCCIDSLKPVKVLAQQIPTFLFFCDRKSGAGQCCAHLHGTTTYNVDPQAAQAMNL